jgi:recombinational DNA repair protein RecR
MKKYNEGIYLTKLKDNTKRRGKIYHSLQASNAHLEVCRMCFQFAEEVCEDDCVPVPAR